MPPRETESAPDVDGDESGTVVAATERPVSKRRDPAWASEEWVTATVPVFTEATAMEAGQEQDLVDALVTALDGDHVRIQRIVDALTELMLKAR